nr:hypothetical protein [Micromonospora provocatoris]
MSSPPPSGVAATERSTTSPSCSRTPVNATAAVAPGSTVVSPAVAAAPIPSSWKLRASVGATSSPSRRTPVTCTVPTARVASAQADPVVFVTVRSRRTWSPAR